MAVPVLSKKKCLLCNIETKPLFRFPLNPERMLTWMKIIGKENLLEDGTYSKEYILNNARLCSSHFTSSAFSSSLQNKLCSTALPKNPELVSESSSTLCDFHHVQGTPHRGPILHSTPKSAAPKPRALVMTPKTRKILELKAKCRAMKFKLNSSINQGLQKVKSIVTATQYEFILSQLKVAKLKDKRGSRWSNKDKSVALNIYLQSPAAYQVLRKFYAFPSKSTLKRSTGQISKSDGTCPKVLAALTEKAKKMSLIDKFCILVFDEMAIKSFLSYNATLDLVDGFESCIREDGSAPEFATQALVFMIRGLCKNWKQVFAYYFRGNKAPESWLKQTVFEIIDKVNSCGFKIVATVCDQGPLNQSLYKSLGVSPENPFFTYNDSIIFALYDVPHLLKSVRNNLKNYDVTFLEIKDESDESNRMRASWKDIEMFYENDSKQRFRVAPKLTYKHVFARGLSTMKVKLAAQIFSHSVAAGLCVYANTGVLDTKALQTAEFVGMMNELFDSLNSKNRFSAVSENSNHVNLWKKSVKWVNSWNFVTTSGKVMKPACQKGWIITLNATIGIWEKLNKDISYLCTNRLNQDCLENTFSSIRRKGGFNDNPSAFEFRSAIRSVIVYNFVRKTNANCEDDNDVNLLEVDNVEDRSIIAKLCGNEDDDIHDDYWDDTLPLVIDDIPEPTTNDIENNVIAYISGFLAKKYLKKYSCKDCENVLIGPKDLDKHTLLLYFKEYNIDADSEYGLKWPSDEFYETMRDASEVFFKNINNYFNKPNIRKNLIAALQIVDFGFFHDHSHKDDAKKYFLFSFVTMMIKHKVRVKNGEIYNKLVENKKMKKVKHL